MEGGKLKNLYLLIIVPIGIVLGLFGYIGSFNRLLGDSFCSFFHAEKLGLLRSIWYWRITWSGRYTAFIFDWLVMKVFGAKYINLFIPVILILWVCINIITVHLLLLKKNRPGKGRLQLASILGLVVVFLMLTNSPTIQQSVLWLDGFRAYTLPIIILPAYFSLYLYFSDRIKSKASLIISAFVAFWGFFISGGLSETYSVFQLTLLVFLIAYYWITEQPTALDKNLIILISGLIGAFISILVIVTAPGNPVRQSFFPPPPGLFELIRISFFGYFNFLNKILSAPEKILGGIASMLISFWAGLGYDIQIRQTGKKTLLLFFGVFMLSFACFPPGVYGYSESPPDRVLIIALFAIITPLMLICFFAGNSIKQTPFNTNNTRILLFTAATLFIGISAWVNAGNLYNSRSIYIEFARKWDAVDTLILQAKNEGKEVVNIPDMSNWAGLDRPNQNINHYMTECYSGFYGIQVFGPP